MKKAVAILFAAAMFISAICIPSLVVYADTADYQSKQALLMEYTTGEILYEKDSTFARPIASMVKIMTLLCVYDAVDNGKIALDDEVTISNTAASMGGSQVFLAEGDVHKVSDLVKTIIVASANDSCVALAEHVSGSQENFVDTMNDKAAQLGLVNTNFVNCTGLPAAGQFSCAADVAVMMRELIGHEHYFTCSRIWLEDYPHPDGRVIGITNTNKLVRFYEGCDGGKTGFTNEAMFCLCCTAVRKGTRYIAVVIASPDSKTRFGEASKLLNYGFANYECKSYLTTDDVYELTVKGGKEKNLNVTVKDNLYVFGNKGSVKGELVVELPDQIKAPVCRGDIVGSAYVIDDGNVLAQADIVALNDVDVKSYGDCLRDIKDNW